MSTAKEIRRKTEENFQKAFKSQIDQQEKQAKVLTGLKGEIKDAQVELKSVNEVKEIAEIDLKATEGCKATIIKECAKKKEQTDNELSELTRQKELFKQDKAIEENRLKAENSDVTKRTLKLQEDLKGLAYSQKKNQAVLDSIETAKKDYQKLIDTLNESKLDLDEQKYQFKEKKDKFHAEMKETRNKITKLDETKLNLEGREMKYGEDIYKLADRKKAADDRDVEQNDRELEQDAREVLLDKAQRRIDNTLEIKNGETN